MSSTQDRRKNKNIKEYLIERSEEMVDFIEELDEAIEMNDEPDSKQAVLKLNDIGNELVDLIPNLEGDDLAYANFMMGSLCSTLRMWPEAAEAYEQALTTWPEHVGVLNEYFVSLYELKRFDEAVSIMKKSIEVGGETPDTIQNLAVAQLAAGQEAEARLTLMNGMAKYPDDNQLIHTMYELDKQEEES
jgi:tetratricopeptide (TPR) repeat protein